MIHYHSPSIRTPAGFSKQLNDTDNNTDSDTDNDTDSDTDSDTGNDTVSLLIDTDTCCGMRSTQLNDHNDDTLCELDSYSWQLEKKHISLSTRPSALGMSDPVMEPENVPGTQERCNR